VPLIEIIDLEQYYSPPLATFPSTKRYTRADASFTFVLNQPIAGDILIRLYSDVGMGAKTLLTRCLFHTAFIGSEGTKDGDLLTFEIHRFQLDNPQNGALSDSRYMHYAIQAPLPHCLADCHPLLSYCCCCC
jgi:hypothetical protein